MSRRGVSLVELLVVMTACSAVLALTSQLVCRVMRIQVESRAHADVERNAMRLSEQFRRDVHQAVSAETQRTEPVEPVLVQLRFSDGRQVEYSQQDGQLLRLGTGGGIPDSREEFVFPRGCEALVREASAPQRLLLSVTGGPHNAAAPPADAKSPATAPIIPVSVYVEAQLGRDWRFSDRPERKETPE